MGQGKKSGSWVKKAAMVAVLVILVAGFLGWRIYAAKFDDTNDAKADYRVTASELIREFEANDPVANKKYAEKIVMVTGTVTGVEKADTTVNIKMTDPAKGSYIMFSFQQDDMKGAGLLKEGAVVSIKGSCSGGAYSEILETEFINFKRCVISKK